LTVALAADAPGAAAPATAVLLPFAPGGAQCCGGGMLRRAKTAETAEARRAQATC